MQISNWYKKHFSQTELANMYISMTDELTAIREKYNRCESSEENRFLDEMDGLWYALDSDSIDKIKQVR